MYRPLIEICLNNSVSGSEKLKKHLERDGKVDVLEYDCLGYCEICAMNLYALVNGDIITGENEEELITKIYQHLNEQTFLE